MHASLYAAMAADRRADDLEARCHALTDALADLTLAYIKRGRELDKWRAFGEQLYKEMAERGRDVRQARQALADMRLGSNR